MLSHLLISNFALIDKLETDFTSGFTTITGETGAGKSIILDALSLVLGQRADTKVLKDKKKKCIVEGKFLLNRTNLIDFFSSNDLDYETELVLRREISPEGKSRAFINDTPVLLNIMKELGDKLVDIHSQHKNLSINESDFQLYIVDCYAGITDKVSEYSKKYSYWKDLIRIFTEQSELEKNAKKEQDYLQFLFDEIHQVNLKSNESEDLENELQLLNNVEHIKLSLSSAIQSLKNSETNAIQLIQNSYNQLFQIEKFDARFLGLAERIKSCLIEAKDISDELEDIEEQTTFNKDRYDLIVGRLNEINRLIQKHQVKSSNDLVFVKEEIEEKLSQIENQESKVKQLESEIIASEKELWSLANDLTKQRTKVFSEIEKKSISLLQQLGMPEVRIKISSEKSKTLKSHGTDEISFLFSANKGMELSEISRIASGGEISRLMLVFKHIISGKKLLPTIIFDEIDSGMSGEVAYKTGCIMKEMSENMQVFSVTHLPQIAALGNQQLQVYKSSSEKTTEVFLKSLKKEERIEAIAMMLGDGKIAEHTQKLAKKMLE